MSRYWPTLSSMRSSFHSRQTSVGAPSSSSSESTKARSPTRIATPSPKRRDSPDQLALPWVPAYTACVVGAPRRLAESSITSSWNRAKACISSNAAPARTTRSSSGSPPAPTNPQWQNAGRRRLPPERTMRRISSNGPARSASNAAQRSRDAASRSSRHASTRAAMAAREGGGVDVTCRDYAATRRAKLRRANTRRRSDGTRADHLIDWCSAPAPIRMTIGLTPRRRRRRDRRSPRRCAAGRRRCARGTPRSASSPGPRARRGGRRRHRCPRARAGWRRARRAPGRSRGSSGAGLTMGSSLVRRGCAACRRRPPWSGRRRGRRRRARATTRPSAVRVMLHPRASVVTGSSERTRASIAGRCRSSAASSCGRRAGIRSASAWRRRSASSTGRVAAVRRRWTRRAEALVGALDGGVGAPGDAVGPVGERPGRCRRAAPGVAATIDACRCSTSVRYVPTRATRWAAHAVGVFSDVWATSSATLRSIS